MSKQHCPRSWIDSGFHVCCLLNKHKGKHRCCCGVIRKNYKHSNRKSPPTKERTMEETIVIENTTPKSTKVLNAAADVVCVAQAAFVVRKGVMFAMKLIKSR